MHPRSHYEVLQLTPSADHETIKRAYQRLLLVHHPDKSGDAAAFVALQSAWRTLSDPQARAAYDVTLTTQQLQLQKAHVVHDRVHTSAMAWDEEAGTLEWPCRCGAIVCVTQDELERGVVVVGCPSCSLQVAIELD